MPSRGSARSLAELFRGIQGGVARIRYALPAITLVVIALYHHWLVSAQGLTQWKGGGFGMFSTVDSGGTRFLAVTGMRKGQEYRIEPPHELNSLIQLAKSLPSGELLQKLQDELARVVWALEPKRSFAIPKPPILPIAYPLSDTDGGLIAGARLQPTLSVYDNLKSDSSGVCILDSIKIEVFSMDYSLDSAVISRRIKVELVGGALDLNQVSEKTGLSLSYLTRNDI